jgi:hypothetical protein
MTPPRSPAPTSRSTAAGPRSRAGVGNSIFASSWPGSSRPSTFCFGEICVGWAKRSVPTIKPRCRSEWWARCALPTLRFRLSSFAKLREGGAVISGNIARVVEFSSHSGGTQVLLRLWLRNAFERAIRRPRSAQRSWWMEWRSNTSRSRRPVRSERGSALLPGDNDVVRFGWAQQVLELRPAP